jgi:hypothetical protein
MADDQIARRYPDPAQAYARLPLLKEAKLVHLWWKTLEGSRCYSATNLGNTLARVRELVALTNRETHLAHDVAVVDLADFLLQAEPGVEWRTERELRPFLDAIAPPRTRMQGDHRHRPDGLLLADGERIGIELEHTDKYVSRYTQISDWFAREWRIDRVRWYVDNPTIVERLRRINSQHGFDRDIQITIEPFPPGVRIRGQLGRFEP